jgi:hypothetical protein
LFTTSYLFPLPFGFDANFSHLGIYRRKTEFVPHKMSRNETIQLHMISDKNHMVGNVIDKTFSPPRRQKYLPDTEGPEVPALFLLE